MYVRSHQGRLAEGAAWNDEEYDVLREHRIRFASRGALGDGTLPFPHFSNFKEKAHLDRSAWAFKITNNF
jgi:hypothetical protein